MTLGALIGALSTIFQRTPSICHWECPVAEGEVETGDLLVPAVRPGGTRQGSEGRGSCLVP